MINGNELKKKKKDVVYKCKGNVRLLRIVIGKFMFYCYYCNYVLVKKFS